MIDAVIRKGIEEALRFVQPGVGYRCEVDGHDVTIVRLATSAPAFLVACHTCRALVVDDVELKRVYIRIHKHTEEPIE